MYWNMEKSLTRNRLLNFIVGNRGSGKTYGLKRFTIKRFLRYGEQFVYVRRFDTELKKTIPRYFNDIMGEFPNTTLEVKGSEFVIDGDTAGYAIALSKAKIEKSTAYPDVKWIIFDEFVLDRGYHRYLKDEVTTFLELYETIARLRDGVRVFFLGNAISFINPYFLYFGVKPPKEQSGIVVSGEILVEYVAEPDFIDAKKNTRFGKLIAGTEYGDYAIDNVSLRDNDSFVMERMPSAPAYYCTIKSGGKLYGVWWGEDGSIMYICDRFDKTWPTVYTVTLEDHTPNTLFLTGGVRNPHIATMKKAFMLGKLYFQSMAIKNDILQVMRVMG